MSADKLERAAVAVHRGFFYFKAVAWTVFALFGPMVFLGMRNYLGVAVTSGIGIAIAAFLFSARHPFPGRRELRILLFVQGTALAGYGVYMLTRPAAPWIHVAASTRASVVVAEETGAAYALEFSERARFFERRPGESEWHAARFPGYLASAIALGPAGATVYAPEDRAERTWSLQVGDDGDWQERHGFGFRSALSASDKAMFVAARGKLWRIDTPTGHERPVPEVGEATTVCARGLHVVAMQTAPSGRGGRTWRSNDGGDHFVEQERGGSVPVSRCALSSDGTTWASDEGLFVGDLAVARPGEPFVAKSVPAPRVEALVVNPGNAQEAWIGTWGAGVYRTLDGGESWESMGLAGYEVSDLAVDFARRIAFAGAGSGVYQRSIDP